MLGNIFHSISSFSLFTGTASRVKGLEKRGGLKIEKTTAECAGLPEGKTASSRNVLASVPDQAVLLKKKNLDSCH